MKIWLGLLLALLPTYLIRSQALGFPTTLLEILLLVFLFFVLLRTRERDIHALKRLGSINWVAGLFVLAGIINFALSPEKMHALGQLKAFIIEPVLFFYAIVLMFKSEKDLALPFRWLFISTSLISAFGIIQYFTFINLPFRFWGMGEEVRRITSVFEYPNALALFLAPLLIFFFTLWLNHYPLFKRARIEKFGLTAMTVALIMTFSRGAWVAVLAVAVLVFLRKHSWKRILPLIFIGALVLLLIPAVNQRFNLGLSDASSIAHWDLMHVGINKVIQSPIIGNGLYGFRTTLEQAGFTGEILNYPHNIFLNFWLELGLLGLLAFALIIFHAAESFKKHPSLLKFAAGMFLLTLIIHGLVDVPYFKNDLSVLFWFMTAIFFI